MAEQNIKAHPSNGSNAAKEKNIRLGAFDVDMSEIKSAMVRLDAKSELAPYPVSWVQICKIGKFEGHYAGVFEFTEELFGQIIKNFRSTQNRALPLDFEHASEMPGYAGNIPASGAPATGWIIELQNRGASGLWGMVAWLEPGLTYVRERRYRYLSPAFCMDSYDRVTGDYIGCELTSAALTNRPFLDGMASVTASQRRIDQAMSEQEKTTKNNNTFETAIRLALADRAKPTFDENLNVISSLVEENKELATKVATFSAREEAEIAKKIESEIAILLSNGSIMAESVDDARKLAKSNPDMFAKLFSHRLTQPPKPAKPDAPPSGTTLASRQVDAEPNASKAPGTSAPAPTNADRDAVIEKIAVRLASAKNMMTRNGRPNSNAYQMAIAEYNRGERE